MDETSEIIILKQIIQNFLSEDVITKNLSHTISLLHEYRLLLYLTHDSTNEASKTCNASKNLLKAWNNKIINLLQYRSSRYAALHLLRETLLVSNYDLFVGYYNQWQTILIQIFKKKEELDQVQRAAILTIGTYICRSILWPDIRRDVLQNGLPQILPLIIKGLENDSPHCNESLIVISSILKCIKNSLKTQISTIKSLTVPLLTNISKEIRKRAAFVLSLLPINALAWSELVNEILLNLENFTQQAFYGIEEDNSLEGNFQFDNTMKCQTLLNSFESYSYCLMLLLGNNYNFTNSVPIDHILQFLLKIFNVDGSNLNKHVTGYSILEMNSIIPSLHKYSYRILNSLIKSVKTSLYPNLKIICKIMLHGLNCGTQTNCFCLKQISLRCYQYKLASHTIQLGSSGIIKNFILPILEHIFQDIKLNNNIKQQNIVRINESRVNKRQKKKKTKLGEVKQLSISGEEVIDHMMKGDVNYNEIPLIIQKSALKVLNTILVYTGSNLPKETRVNIDKVLLNLVLTMISLPISWNITEIPLNFQDKSYRKLVYKSIKTSLIAPQYTQSPLLPYAVKCFNYGLNDPCLEVVNVCREGLSTATIILHPMAPAIYPKERTIPYHQDYVNPLSLHNVKDDICIQIIDKEKVNTTSKMMKESRNDDIMVDTQQEKNITMDTTTVMDSSSNYQTKDLLSPSSTVFGNPVIKIQQQQQQQQQQSEIITKNTPDMSDSDAELPDIVDDAPDSDDVDLDE